MLKRRLLFLICLFVFFSLDISASQRVVPEERDQDRIKETIIFFPAKEINTVLGIEKEGIFVSGEEYKNLYEKAKNAYTKKRNEAVLPAGVKGPIIVQANYRGSVQDDILKLSARYRVVSNKEKPEILDFPLKDVLYLNARLNGNKALIYEKDTSPKVIIPGKGSFELAVDFFVPIDFREKRGLVSFNIPVAVMGDIRLTTDPFYDIHFQNVLFASKKQVGDKTEFLGFFGCADTLSLEITNQRSSGEKSAKVISKEKHSLFLSPDHIGQTAEYILDVQNGEIEEVDITIGKNVHVFEISGPGISDWNRKEKAGADVLHINFHIPISGQTTFSLITYQDADTKKGAFSLADFRIEDLFERKGTLSVFYDKSIRIDTENIRFLQPLPLTGDSKSRDPANRHVLYREYRIFNLPYEAVFSLQDVPVQTVMHQQNQLRLESSKIIFHSEMTLSGLNQGTTRFSFKYPGGYILRDINTFINDRPVKEDHGLNTEENSLFINVRYPISSKDEITFLVDCERFLDEESFKKEPQTIDIPAITYPDARKMTGELQITIDELFLLENIILKGYVPQQEMTAPDAGRTQEKKLLYNLLTLSPEGTITLSLREAELISHTVTYIAADEDLLQTNAYIQYEITSGKKDSFYFAVPRWEDSKINIEGADIKEKKKISPDKIKEKLTKTQLNALKNHDIWNVVLQKEITGNYFLEIDYQKKIEEFNVLFDVPLVSPIDVINDTGYVILEASKNTEIATQKTGLNDIETYEIPPWPSYKPSNRIIESLRYFSRPFTFRIGVNRRDESPVLASIAENETASYTFGMDSDVFVEYNYFLKNTNLQFLEIQPPRGFELWGVTLQGKGIKPRKGENNLLLIPLQTESSQNITLRLTGVMQRKGRHNIWQSFALQSPKLSIPCLQSSMDFYFPDKYSLFNISGNFEKFPEPEYQKPVLLSLFKKVSSFLSGNMKSMFGPAFISRGVQGRLMSATDNIGGQFSMGQTIQYEPYYLNTDQKVERSEKEEIQDIQDDGLRALGGMQTSVTAGSAPGGPAVVPPEYTKKKGILSLSIDIPKEGNLLSANKLWGNSRLSVTFISDALKKALSLASALFFIIIGFTLRRKQIMTPFGFLVTTLVLCTLLPLAIFKPLVFIFNGAIWGAVIFTIILIVNSFLKKALSRSGFHFILIFFLFPLFLSPQQFAFAEGEGSFPDVKVYVPYKGEVPFKLKGTERLYIPTDDYFRLKLLAEPPYWPETTLKFENDFNITGFKADGALEENRIKFTASLDIFVNVDKWVLVDLPFRDVYIEELKLDGRSIAVKTKKSSQGLFQTGSQQFISQGQGIVSQQLRRISSQPAASQVSLPFSQQQMSVPRQAESQYSFPFSPKETDIYEIPVLGPGHHSVELLFSVEIESLPGKKILAFGFPKSLLADFSLNLKNKDMFIEFEYPKDGFITDDSGEHTVVRGSLSGKSDLKISWFPKKYLKKEEKPLIYADCDLSIFMGYEEVLVSQQTKVRVEKSSIASLSFQKDPRLVIIDVFSNKVKNWQAREEDGNSFLDITFKHEITDSADLLIKAKHRVMPETLVPVLFLKPLDAKRVHGNLSLYASPDYTLDVKNIEGLKVSEMKPSNLHASREEVSRKGFIPEDVIPALRGGAYTEATKNEIFQDTPGFQHQKTYSFLNSDFNADIARVPQEKKVSADILSRHILSEDLLTSSYTVDLDIKKNSISAVKIRIPEGQKIDSLKADGISDYILQDNVLTLPLTGARKGKFQFSLKLEDELKSFDSAVIEGIEILDVQKVTGTMFILFPRGFAVKESAVSGLRPTDIEAVSHESNAAGQTDFGAKYAYTIREWPFKASFDISKEQPSIDVIKVYHSIVKDNLVNVSLLSLFNIKNAPVDHIEVIVPADLKDSIKIQGDGIKTILKKEINEGKDVSVTVNTISKIDRAYMLQISFNKYFDNAKIFEMPRIVFPQAANRTEFISVETATVYQVEPKVTQSLHEIEASMIPALPDGIDLNNILWSYRASGSSGWKYSLELKRLEREKLADAKILREDIKTLIIPNGFALHEVNIKANNRALQFLPVYLPPQADLWSLKVAGEPSRASFEKTQDKKKSKKYLIPLIKSGAGDRSFDITLVYITPIKKLGRFGKIDLQMMETGELPIEKTTWTLFVPDNYSYPKVKTNMEEIERSMIEAEKTLELANEYKYWTKMADFSKGELRKKAMDNRAKVMDDYTRQQELNVRSQNDLDTRAGNKRFDQKLVQRAQSRNIQTLDEANQIISSNQPVSQIRQEEKMQRAKQDISGRRKVKGWQFKTNGFSGERQVKENIDTYLEHQDKQASIQKTKSEEKRRSEFKKGKNAVQDLKRSYAKDEIHKDIGELKPLSKEELQNVERAIGDYSASDFDLGFEESGRSRLNAFEGISEKEPSEMFQLPETTRENLGQIAQFGTGQAAASGSFAAVRDSASLRRVSPPPPGPKQTIVSEGINGETDEFWDSPQSAPVFPQKIQAPAQKMSALLKGLRSIDIPIPEQGMRFSFKKLGGNPGMTISYRKKGSLSKIFLLLLCIVAGAGTFKIRKYRFPAEKITEKLRSIFGQIHLSDLFDRITDSRLLKIITFVAVIPALILGSPLALIALGLISLFFLRFISLKRYAKMGYAPAYNIRIFLKNLLSYIILIASVLSFFNMIFLIPLGISTALNFILALAYGVFTIFTPRVTIEEPEKDEEKE